VVDDKGEVQMQTEVVTDPDAIAATLKPFLPRPRRAGHEAGSLSPWLQPQLVERGLPAVCLETKHVRAAMSAQRNKTDAADALGLAHIVWTGWFRQAHIKTASCYRLRLLLTQRRNLKRKVLDLENTIRHSLKAFGIRIKGTGRTGFDTAVREAVVDDAVISELMDAMLAARAMPWKQHRRLHDLEGQLAGGLQLQNDSGGEGL
jgi:transposase